MPVQTQLYTLEQFLDEYGHAKHVELVKGVPVEMSPTGRAHGLIALMLGAMILAFVQEHDLGETYGAETGFRLSDDPPTVRALDVSFITRIRAASQAADSYISGPPDLAVEIVSPGDRAGDIQAKINDYLDAGTRLIWVIYPQTRMITVYTPGTSTAHLLREGDTLTGGDVLPGFSVPVANVFSSLPTD